MQCVAREPHSNLDSRTSSSCHYCESIARSAALPVIVVVVVAVATHSKQTIEACTQVANGFAVDGCLLDWLPGRHTHGLLEPSNVIFMNRNEAQKLPKKGGKGEKEWESRQWQRVAEKRGTLIAVKGEL